MTSFPSPYKNRKDMAVDLAADKSTLCFTRLGGGNVATE